MSNTIELVAENRTDTGKGASRRLRHADKVPAILYGGRRDSRSITLDHSILLQHLENEAFYSSILSITIGDKTQPCILKDVQRHPAKNRILHVDLQRVLEDEAIRVNVPLHFIGEDVCPGVKMGGVISHLMNEIEVVCLPKNLPEYIDVDLSEVELDGMVHLSELTIPEGVQVPQLAPEDGRDPGVASVQRVKAVVEEEEAEEGEIGEEAPEEDGETE